MEHKVKKYELPEDNQPALVSEPVTAVKYSAVHVEPEPESWDSEDAPCRYTIDELQEVIRQSLADKNAGRVHQHAEVQRMIKNRIQSWR